MKTFTNCAEKKAKQFFNLLQGYTKGIRMTAILILLLMGVSNAWGKTSFYLTANTEAWDKAGAKFSIYYTIDGTNWKFSDFMGKVKDDFYTVTVEENDIKTIIAVRHSNTATQPKWNTNNDQSQVWNQTSNIDISSSKHNRIDITGFTGDGITTYKTLSDGLHDYLEEKDIYFDNTFTQWEKVYLRVGTGAFDPNASGYARAYEMQKVPGTDNLYKHRLEKWYGYGMSNFANNWGWQGNGNQIVQPYRIYNDEYKMTGQTSYHGYELQHNNLFIPYAKSLEPDNECYDYSTNNFNSYTKEVTIHNHAGGTVTISYTNEKEQTITKTDGSFIVAQTCILKVESVDPKEGYRFNQVSFYDGEHYHVKNIGETFVVRAGTTIYPEFVTSETNKVYLKLSDDAYKDWTQVDATIAVYAWAYIDEEIPGNWFTMTKIPSKDDNIYSCEIPEGYTGFCFVRLCPSGHQDYKSDNNGFNWDNKWNQSQDLTFTEVIAGGKYYNLTNKPNDKYTGQWLDGTSVKLDPCAYGKYGFTFDNETIWCNETHNMDDFKEVKIPTGAKIQIIDFDASSISPEYKLNPRYKYSTLVQIASTADFINLDDIGLDYAVTENIWVVPNIVMAQPHTVYLHIPKEFIGDWNSNDANYQWNTMYLTDYLSGGQIIRDSDQERVAHLLTAEKDIYLSNQEQGEYWYFNIPAGYNSYIIERKTNNNDDNTGEGGAANNSYLCSATDKFYFRNPLDENNCYTLTSKREGTKWNGTWETMPNCTITLGYCEFGTHGIKYNGQEYFASNDEKTNVEIVVPYGAEVEVLAGRPLSDAYTNHIEMKVNDIKIKTFTTFNGTDNKVAIVGNTLFDDYYLTKEPHDVYIGIPNTGMDNIWYQKIENDKGVPVDGDIYVWPIAQGVGLSNLAVRTDKFEDEGVTYYKFTLPEGINSFYFQREAYNGGGTTYCQSVELLYEIPLNEENCYMLDKGKTPNSYYTGYWKSMPAHEDFRLLYVEQEVIKAEDTDGDKWLTKVKRTYEHQSDIIKKRNNEGSDVVSLHIYTRGDNPEIILQQYDDEKNKWIDIEAHMVNGPLEALPGTAMLPGRKNASPGSDIDDFVYDDGIEKIKNDDEDDGCGVWDFKVIQDGKSAKLDLVNGLERYNGKYYIRTANAEGKWIDYTIPANHMTFSPYAKQHHGEYFSHYFCKWVDLDKHYNDVSFIIANDHAKSLTDPSYLFDDKYVNNQWLPENANIRWGWSIINNKVSRAYIAGSYEGANDFLVVNHPKNDTKVTLQENINGVKGYFNDNTNWLYYADLLARPQAHVQVRAKYNGDYQYFMGKDEEFQKLIGGDANDERYYPIRILYDFKEHRFVVGYHPETEITDKVAIETPVMLIREHHNAPNQITFNNDNLTIEAPMPAYGVITFLEKELKSDKISKNAKMFYWVSFPFDVRISHAFGLGEYGSHWVMEEYDGEARAEEGWNIYNTFWRYITDTATTLQAGKGYVLCLNYNRVINEAFLSAEHDEKISLYFPSIEEVNQSTIKNQGSKEIEIPTWTGAAPQKDHNWNLIGAISYANTGETTQQSNAKFLYEYQPDDDTYSPRASNGYTFNALHAYMVQYGGKITWDNFIAVVPQAIAAKRDAENDDNMHELSLDLILNGTTQDQTFIQLEDGEATQMFDLNIDMTKIINSGSNIYSISDDNNKLAGSVIPIEETIIPLGVVSAAAGEYTFAMPEGTDGIVVELIDYETNTRTNMLLDNYTVNLGKGTFDNRFALHVKPDKTTTSVDNIGNEATGDKVKKYLIDGVLYMQKDGVLYDAQGRCVQ